MFRTTAESKAKCASVSAMPHARRISSEILMTAREGDLSGRTGGLGAAVAVFGGGPAGGGVREHASRAEESATKVESAFMETSFSSLTPRTCPRKPGK
jgi:hypothetical protein